MWVLLNQLDQERVIYNSQIHPETNLVTQQVSHPFLCNNAV